MQQLQKDFDVYFVSLYPGLGNDFCS